MNIVELKYNFRSENTVLQHSCMVLTTLTQKTIDLALNHWLSKTNSGLPEDFIDHMSFLGFSIKKVPQNLLK